MYAFLDSFQENRHVFKLKYMLLTLRQLRIKICVVYHECVKLLNILFYHFKQVTFKGQINLYKQFHTDLT